MNKSASIRRLRLLILGLFFLFGSGGRINRFRRSLIFGLGKYSIGYSRLSCDARRFGSAWDYPWRWANRTKWGAWEVATDSFCDGSIIPMDTYYGHNAADVIAYELGTVGRQSGHYVQGFGPGDQKVYLEGIDLSNPITGLNELQYVPVHKVSSIHSLLTSPALGLAFT